MLNTDRLCLGCMNDNGGERVCAICGYDSASQNDAERLPTKFWLNDRYLVGLVLQSNGEGTTYMGWDNSEDSIVKIREYFPAGAAIRNPDKTVSISAQEKKFIFNDGLMSFLELQKKLMELQLPSLIPVKNVFEENGTAYSVIEGFSGISLQDFLIRNGGTLKWEQARALFLPLIDTVAEINKAGIIHGGISPDTILVGRDGKLRLGGICISKVRSAASEMTSQIYPGFAAPEQYGFEGLEMGEYTDVYALSATLFRVLIGITPPEASERMEHDGLSIPSRFAEELPHTVLAALANGLQVQPASRTESTESFKNQIISGEAAAPVKRRAEVSSVRSTPAQSPVEHETKPKKGSGAKYAVISALCTAAFFLIISGVLVLTVFRNDLFGKSKETINDTSDFSSAPSVASIGDYDSNAAESVTLYAVPDLSGKYYSQITGNEEYSKFQFVIKGKEYSSKSAKGTVCAQSVAVGSNVQKDTTIELTISLGPQEIKVANVVGLDEVSAKIELLKQGFLYENIEVVDMYDSDSKPGVVLEQTPEYGTAVNTEVNIRICVNSYKGETESDTSSGQSFTQSTAGSSKIR